MTHLDLFSGIGGFAYAIDQVWDNVEHTFCDNDKFCQQVLKKHWPNSKIYGDIREITTNGISTDGGRKVNGNTENEERETSANRREGIQPKNGKARSNNTEQGYDIITGGFPCQPFSQAGKRRGTDDNRYLWPEMFRVIQLTRPTWVVAENVYGILNIEGGMVFEQVCTDLEGEGFEVQPFIIPAVSVNAPHRRDRVWFVANRASAGTRGDAGGLRNKSVGESGGSQTTTNARSTGLEEAGAKQQATRIGRKGGDATDTRQQYGKQGNDERMGADTTERTTRTADAQRQGEDATDSTGEGWKGDGTEGSGRLGQPNRAWEGETQNNFDVRSWNEDWTEVATEFCGMDDGLPTELDGFELTKAGHRKERLKSLGNAIVPQVAIEIMKAIRHTEGN